MNKAKILSAVLGLAAAAFLAVDTAEKEPPRGISLPDRSAAPSPAAVPIDAEPRNGGLSASATNEATGLPGRTDRRCELELGDYVAPSGETFSAYRCTPEAPAQPHPYAHYDNGSLEQLAYADSEAAALLGRRLIGSDPAKSYEMLLRATALSGELGHLAWLSDQAYSTVRIDGDLQIINVKRRYELAALAAQLGGDPAAAQFFRNELIGAGLGADGLAPLDARVDELLHAVHEVQRTVFGKVRYGGQNDA